MPSNDHLPNLVKYALGLPLSPPGNGGRLASSIQLDGSADYLTFTYVHPDPAPSDISYAVESTPDLGVTPWSTASVVPVGSTVNGGLRTVVVRLATPSDSGKQFMRLKVSRP
ncbi:MAG TPA: hypothetical protein VM511_04185 [Luteolibacter sp.]|nr:hypothetical protein [Luteolibacter sp.]